MNPITPAQRKKIYALARQLGMSSETLHLYLKNTIGKEHISQLTRAEAWRFTEKLNKILQDRQEKCALIASDPNLTSCTPSQIARIKNLAEEIGWTPGKIDEYIAQWGAKRLESLTQTLAKEMIKEMETQHRLQRRSDAIQRR
jgi:hypothetical protein